MASIFYKERFERRFPLPMLTLERAQALFSTLDVDAATDRDVNQCIKQALKETCNACPSPGLDDLAYVVDRMNKMMKDSPDEEVPLPKTRSLASSFITWAAGLETDQVCLVASGFDYKKAKFLYTEVDRDDVVEMAQQFLTMEMEKVKVGYESVVYGFGGSYEGDKTGPSNEGNTHDLTKDSPRGLLA